MPISKRVKKTILVTGANGFLGKALFYFLDRETTNKIVGFDLRFLSQRRNLFLCDLSNISDVKRRLEKLRPDIIFHCAGGRGNDTRKVLLNNIKITEILFYAIKAIKSYHPRVIIPGSAAEYGIPKKRQRKFVESHRAKPFSDYGKVKLRQTELALRNLNGSVDVVVGRIFNILGKNTPAGLVAGCFAKKIVQIENQKKIKSIIYTRNLDGKRDFLDIEDVCSALWAIAQNGKNGQIYNICSGRPIGIKELLKKFVASSKVKDIEIKENSEKISKTFDAIGSIRKLKRDIHWTYRISLEKSIVKTLKSYREGR